jgi:hypothetical protein
MKQADPNINVKIGEIHKYALPVYLCIMSLQWSPWSFAISELYLIKTKYIHNKLNTSTLIMCRGTSETTSNETHRWEKFNTIIHAPIISYPGAGSTDSRYKGLDCNAPRPQFPWFQGDRLTKANKQSPTTTHKNMEPRLYSKRLIE